MHFSNRSQLPRQSLPDSSRRILPLPRYKPSGFRRRNQKANRPAQTTILLTAMISVRRSTRSRIRILFKAARGQ